MSPAYQLNEFKAACAEAKRVRVTRSAMETARSDFGLVQEKRVLEFIAEDGLENPTFVRSAPWENNPDKSNPVLVDSYDFYSGLRFGYLAFMRNPKTNNWLIKSFKKNTKPDSRNLVFVSALRNHRLH